MRGSALWFVFIHCKPLIGSTVNPISSWMHLLYVSGVHSRWVFRTFPFIESLFGTWPRTLWPYLSPFNPNYYQSHCVRSHSLTQQMAIFQPITPLLLSPLSPPSHKHYYVLPCLTRLPRPSSCVTPSVHPSLASLLNFTLLMFITSSPAVVFQTQSAPVLINLRAFPESVGELDHWVVPQPVSSSDVTTLTHFITCSPRWRTVCRNISWLHGAGLCHLSHSRQASPNQNRTTRLPMVKWWEIFKLVSLIKHLQLYVDGSLQVLTCLSVTPCDQISLLGSLRK